MKIGLNLRIFNIKIVTSLVSKIVKIGRDSIYIEIALIRQNIIILL